MSGANQSVFDDTDLVEMLIGEPELLAIAEALVTSVSMPDSQLAPCRLQCHLDGHRALPRSRRL
jgi:hypothetical protein